MRRAVVIAALAAAVTLGVSTAGGLPESAAQPRPSDSRAGWRSEECRYQSLEAGTWTAREERLTAECAVARWPVPGGLAKLVQVGSCESGWWRLASNGGRYLGLFQHAASSWSGRVDAYAPARWDRGLSPRWQNSRTQIVVTARMVHASGWSPWSCA